jgi:hypothetical protein
MQASNASLEQRFSAVEDRLAIRELVARYVFRSRDGAMSANGREAIVEQFKARFQVLGVTNHVTHDHVVTLLADGCATGLLSTHAELWRNDTATIAAIRYDDAYEKGADGAWRFATRTLSFLYYLPVADYVTALGRLDRNRAGPDPKPADYPERLPTWVDYRPGGRPA